MKICSYGCGQEGRFTLKNGKSCCSEKYNLCSEIKKKRATMNARFFSLSIGLLPTKICRKCGEKKLNEEFSGNNVVWGFCKDCRTKHWEEFKENTKARWVENLPH